MKHIAFHDEAGIITGTQGGLQPKHLDEYRRRGIRFTEIPDPRMNMREHMIVEGQLVERETLPVSISKLEIVADGVDEAVISGLPEGITVRIDGEQHQVEGGQLELSSDVAADYEIIIDQLPYVALYTVIKAVAP